MFDILFMKYMRVPAAQHIRSTFGSDIELLKAGEYDDWKKVPGKLAAIILADQFTRNAYRGTPDMFSLDPRARSLTKSLIVSYARFRAVCAAGATTLCRLCLLRYQRRTSM